MSEKTVQTAGRNQPGFSQETIAEKTGISRLAFQMIQGLIYGASSFIIFVKVES